MNDLKFSRKRFEIRVTFVLRQFLNYPKWRHVTARLGGPMDAVTKAIVDALKCVGANKGTIYVTVPITSGLREFTLMSNLGIRDRSIRNRFRDRWIREVKEPNEADARAYTLMVQVQSPNRLVLNPAELQVSDWSQKQYNDMWDAVLAEFCDKLVVSPYWAFSSGGRMEVQRMFLLNRRVEDLFGNPVTKVVVEEADRKVHEQLADMGFSSEEIQGLLPPVKIPAATVGVTRFEDHDFNDTIKWILEERQWQNRVQSFDDRLRTDRHGAKDENGEWRVMLDKYFEQARQTGVETDEGRTKLLVFVTLAVAMMEQVGVAFGPFPEPGVSSGEAITVSQLNAPDMTAEQRLALALAWIAREERYVRSRFSEGHDDENTKEGLGNNSWWYRQLRLYWHKAHQQGLDTPLGRRYLGKYVSTAFGLAMSVVRLYGSPPKPTRKTAEELLSRGLF